MLLLVFQYSVFFLERVKQFSFLLVLLNSFFIIEFQKYQLDTQLYIIFQFLLWPFRILIYFLFILFVLFQNNDYNHKFLGPYYFLFIFFTGNSYCYYNKAHIIAFTLSNPLSQIMLLSDRTVHDQWPIVYFPFFYASTTQAQFWPNYWFFNSC